MNTFQRITINGEVLEGPAIIDAAKRIHETQKGAEWTRPLEVLITDLVLHTGPLAVHTSGTTGDPKPLKLSRRDLVASARLTAESFKLHADDKALLCLPCEYIAGKMMVVRAFVIGLDLHVVDPRGSVLDNLNTKERFRFSAMVPLQLHRAIQEDKSRVEQQFDTILLGGGPVSEALIEDLQAVTTRVFHTYGSTETVTHIAIRQLNCKERSSMFTALGDVTFDQDDRGCLIAYTPHLSTKAHITNDVVDLLDNRHFRWLGRYDNVILSGGLKIFPEQLEAKTAGVVPYPHYFTSYPEDKLGQAVMMVVELEQPSEEIVQEVLDRVKDVLTQYELPRRIMARKTFQRTTSGKVIRTE
ncbi:MAG: AMP-binding protein [Flavobacteriales bacterium]|nr:AMP-binding protein [Flavobacteriales bacterium]